MNWFTGLNPIYRQSGTSIQSSYKIAKSGVNLYRSVLFISVLVAVQHDKNFKAFYERLKSNGKHTTSAQIAVIRKIILTAHSLYKNNSKYDEFSEKMHSSCLPIISNTYSIS
ncbi:transposase [Sulfurimonas sp.]